MSKAESLIDQYLEGYVSRYLEVSKVKKLAKDAAAALIPKLKKLGATNITTKVKQDDEGRYDLEVIFVGEGGERIIELGGSGTGTKSGFQVFVKGKGLGIKSRELLPKNISSPDAIAKIALSTAKSYTKAKGKPFI